MVDSSSTSNFKRLATKLLLFVCLLWGADQIFGKTLATLYQETKEGDFGGRINLALDQQSDLVIFGSSRALHHYIPKEIEAQTGLKAFNAGMDAQTLLYHYSLQQMLFERYQPKVIILDFNTEDLRLDPQHRAYEKLGKLRPFAKHPVVHEFLTHHDPYEALKLKSRIYPYNSMLLSILRYVKNPHAEGSAANSGYVPLHGSQIGQSLAQVSEKSLPSGLDPEYVQVLRCFVNSAKEHGVSLIICQSPLWEMQNGKYHAKHPELRQAYEKLIAELDLPLISITQKDYLQFRKAELFRDPLHLNHLGAQEFSTLLGKKLNNFP